MIIKNMFAEDIDRKINGVVKVEQDESAILVQELDEYVITKELKKHFIDFFRNYGASFEENVSDIGVWISGFFGSGKSHFLKMLSYLLENKEVQASAPWSVSAKNSRTTPLHSSRSSGSPAARHTPSSSTSTYRAPDTKTKQPYFASLPRCFITTWAITART